MSLNTLWTPANLAFLETLPVEIKSWLLEKGSTSKRLKKQFGQLGVHILDQSWGIPTQQETQYFNLPPRKNALIREVHLLGNNTPVMFGRSLFSPAFLQGKYRYIFAYLFHRPLGELLFKIKGIERQELQIAKLLPHHIEYQQATKHLKDPLPPCLWARRSILAMPAGKVMVMDVLFPELTQPNV